MAGVTKTHIQLGDSATATNNFMLTSQTADGTMKLARGNNGATTQDILTVSTAGVVTFTQGLSLLPTRTWQTVTRVGGTAYTAPAWDIIVSVSAITSTNNVAGTIVVQVGTYSLIFAQAGGGAVPQCGFAGQVTIPANSTYTFTLTNTVSVVFSELR